MQGILNDKSYDTQSTTSSASGIFNVMLPKAYAITYVYSTGTLYVQPYSCEYREACVDSDYDFGTEPYELNLYTAGPNEHSLGNTIKVQTSTCSSGDDTTARVTGVLEAKGETFPLWSEGAMCTLSSRTIDLGGNPSAYWFYNVVTTHQAWIE